MVSFKSKFTEINPIEFTYNKGTLLPWYENFNFIDKLVPNKDNYINERVSAYNAVYDALTDDKSAITTTDNGYYNFRDDYIENISQSYAREVWHDMLSVAPIFINIIYTAIKYFDVENSIKEIFIKTTEAMFAPLEIPSEDNDYNPSYYPVWELKVNDDFASKYKNHNSYAYMVQCLYQTLDVMQEFSQSPNTKEDFIVFIKQKYSQEAINQFLEASFNDDIEASNKLKATFAVKRESRRQISSVRASQDEVQGIYEKIMACCKLLLDLIEKGKIFAQEEIEKAYKTYLATGSIG